MVLDVDKALAEVQTKSESVIEAETACKWAARAVACARLGQEARFVHYFGEALEHAALVGDFGKTVGEVQAEVMRLIGEQR